MTAAVANPSIRRAHRVRMTSTTAPDVRRAHPSAPNGRSVGVPAPTLRRGALPAHLQPAPAARIVPTPGSAAAGSWHLTDRAVGLVMALVVILMLTSLAVVVSRVLQVTSADAGSSAAVALR